MSVHDVGEYRGPRSSRDRCSRSTRCCGPGRAPVHPMRGYGRGDRRRDREPDGVRAHRPGRDRGVDPRARSAPGLHASVNGPARRVSGTSSLPLAGWPRSRRERAPGRDRVRPCLQGDVDLQRGERLDALARRSAQSRHDREASRGAPPPPRRAFEEAQTLAELSMFGMPHRQASYQVLVT